MKLFLNVSICAALAAAPEWATADLIPPKGARAAVPVTLIEDRPFLAARANGVAGLAMFDTGTPFALLLNRAFVPLDAGATQASGTAASGQAVEIRDHAPPDALWIADREIALSPQVQSADLAFVAAGMGVALIGFVGAPMVEGGAFALDYDRRQMLLLGTGAGGELTDPPDPAEVLAEVGFLLPEGDQPVFAGTVGGHPLLIDLDTGDTGTLYLSAQTEASWRDAGLVAEAAEGAVLHGLAFGGAEFGAQQVRLVTAGGAGDHRPAGQPDLLRLGGRFLRHHPTLWNMAGHRLAVLRPGSRFFDD